MRTPGVCLAAAVAAAFIAARPAPQDPVLPGTIREVDASRYPSLQAAVDALPPAGGIVRLPAGTFEISRPLVVDRGEITLRGAGAATRIRNVNTAGAPALLVRSADPKTRPWRVNLQDFWIQGNPKSGHGIHAVKVNEIYVSGVSATHNGGDGIRLDDCYEDPRVSDSLLTYNKGSGLHIQAGHDIVVSANHFEENRDGVRCLDSFNLCMNGNNLDDHLGDGVVIENTYGSVVTGNMIEECNGTGIVLDRNCYGITLSANVIAHEVKGGIDLRDAHGCAVSANTFTIVKADALRIGPRSGRITVTGNAFADSYVGADAGEKRKPEDQAAAGLVLEGTTDVVVSGNLFSGLSTPAVTPAGEASSRILFSGNVLAEVKSEHGRIPGLATSGNLEPGR